MVQWFMDRGRNNWRTTMKTTTRHTDPPAFSKLRAARLDLDYPCNDRTSPRARAIPVSTTSFDLARPKTAPGGAAFVDAVRCQRLERW